MRKLKMSKYNWVADLAAHFAQDIDIKSDDIQETLMFSGGIADLSILIGTVMHSENVAAKMHGREFFPVNGAEAAAQYINDAPDETSLATLRSEAVRIAIYEGMTFDD
jgi:hypothetical protein